MSEFMSYEEFLQIREACDASAPESCPIFAALNTLQGKWKNNVLCELCQKDVLRFGELKKALPSITNTMLTATLRELETDGLVNRVQYNEIPPHVEYSLTEKGNDLLPIFYEIAKWGVKHND